MPLFKFKEEASYDKVILLLSGIYEKYKNKKRDEARGLVRKLYNLIINLPQEQFITYFLMLLDIIRRFKDQDEELKLINDAIQKAQKNKMSEELILRLKVEKIKSKLSYGGVDLKELDILFNEFLDFAYKKKNVILLLSYATGIYAPLYLAMKEDEYVVDVLKDTLLTVDEILGELKPKDVLPFLAETLVLLSEVEYKLGRIKDSAEHMLWAARAYHESGMIDEALKALKNYIDLCEKMRVSQNNITKVLGEFYDILDDELKKYFQDTE